MEVNSAALAVRFGVTRPCQVLPHELCAQYLQSMGATLRTCRCAPAGVQLQHATIHSVHTAGPASSGLPGLSCAVRRLSRAAQAHAVQVLSRHGFTTWWQHCSHDCATCATRARRRSVVLMQCHVTSTELKTYHGGEFEAPRGSSPSQLFDPAASVCLLTEIIACDLQQCSSYVVARSILLYSCQPCYGSNTTAASLVGDDHGC